MAEIIDIYFDAWNASDDAERRGFDEFEGITRYSWNVVDAGGNTRSGGLDVVEEGADGRLQRIIMFHGPLPPLG